MQDAKKVNKVGSDSFEAQEEDIFDYEVPNAKTDEPLGRIFLRGFKQVPTLDRYREIRNGNGRTKGDEAKAREYIFKKTYVRFQFIDGGLELDIEEGKTEIHFFLEKTPKVVDAVIQKHLARVFPDIDLKIAIAARLILKSGEGRNPYETAFHKGGCPETVWASEAELLEGREIVKRKCEACRVEHTLWADIIKQTADETTDPITRYGDLAIRGFNLHARVVDFHYPAGELSPFDFALVEAVHQEIKRRESFKVWEQNKNLEK